MKKFFIIILLVLLFPTLNVSALSCYKTTPENPIELTGENMVSNFSCSNIDGDTLKFTHNNTDYSKYFSYENGNVNIIDTSLVFDSSLEVGTILIEDATGSVNLYIKNKAYVKTTSTTTTANPNEITYTVTLNPNNNGETTTKTCTVKKEGDTCNITLPKLEDTYFTGWGKAETCKEGNIGSIRVSENITYYACYSNNNAEPTTNSRDELTLKNIIVYNMDNDEKIDYGTFSIKKKEYNFKVLNEIKKIKVYSEADDNIKISYIMDDSLKVGENEIIIKLTDESNNTAEYKLIVNRLKEGETIENVHYLKSLVIGGFNIDFNKDKFNYDLTIPKDIDKLEIDAIPSDEESEVNIKNNINLKDGSIIEINVIGNDKEATTYKINITKESATNVLLIAAIGVIVLLVILLIILLIVKTKNKKNKTKKETKQTTGTTTTNNEIEVLKF